MPVHDWTRVDDGTFHAFHVGWVLHLSEALNAGLLPDGYYAMPEQHAGPRIADVLTLHAPEPVGSNISLGEGGVAVAEAPPQVKYQRKLVPDPRGKRRTVTIRHVSDHRIVALIEILSPANKDRARHVREFVNKAENALRLGIHLVLADLFPPGRHDPRGIHGAIAKRFGTDEDEPPEEEPLTLAAYAADRPPEAYVEHFAVGAALIEMPLFLTPQRYINVPLEPTYMAAYQGMPAFWRKVLEAPESSAQ
jgi:hypothetical protein